MERSGGGEFQSGYIHIWELENSYEIILRLTTKQNKFNMVAKITFKNEVIVDCTV